jgi:proline iminopeptidase
MSATVQQHPPAVVRSEPRSRVARRWRTALGWLLIAFSGVVAAAALPRGPVTGRQVAGLVAALFLVGAVSGWLLPHRSVALIAPLVHVAGWEIARVTVFRLDGPTFDRPHFGTSMGILVFVAVHVLYALVAGLPLMLGVMAVHGGLRRGGRAAVVWPVVAALLVAGVGMSLFRPAAVAPAAGPGGVAMVTKVRLGGADQWVSIRGDNPANPVLLHLSGGPGTSDVGWVRTFNQPLERRFTVAVWEQRGAGKSYPAVDPTGALTLDRLVADGIELTQWLARRYGAAKIYLTGNSWGSTLGVLMAQRRPDLFHAFVGTGQMVSQRETDRILYRQLAAYAERTGDRQLRDRLAAAGEPPYREVLDYAMAMEYYDVLEPYRHVPAFEAARGLKGFFPGEYGLLDTWNEVRGFADMGGLLYPQLQATDFRTDVPRLDVPVYFVQGRHELTARSALAEQWIAGLRAPVKRVWTFENSGHNADAEEPGRYHDVLVNTVLPETLRR